MNKPDVQMFGLSFNASTLGEAAQMVIAAAEQKKKGLVVTPNVDHIVMMDRDREMKVHYQKAMFRFADGMPLIWFSKIFMKQSLPERVTGADLLPAIALLADEKEMRLFFLGGQDGVAARAAKELQKSSPGLQIAGVYCPPFGFEHDACESTKIVNMINQSGSDILFIGVGAPKQEKWAARHLEQLEVGPILGVGAAFDFAAGTVKRAPLFFQRMGMEWLWRLIKEPRRLCYRYVIQDSRFIFLICKQLWNTRSQ
ncbi:WecB/TagA/CpsF family glycosyltransferase [Mariprofundus ferrooxydans]|nr:WecB/TagA/CpsF family glycosyltransferase [Mariprofundus ferrooxydans]